MKIFYSWTVKYENSRGLPGSLKYDCLERAHFVQFINVELQKVRSTYEGTFFPKILDNPEGKDEFTRILEGDEDTVKRILYFLYCQLQINSQLNPSM
jgi:hypothetical protein